MQAAPTPESNEEQLRLHAQLLNAVEQAVLAVDLTGRIIFWNRFAERLYGWTEDEVHGHNIVEVLAAPLLMEAARANMGQLRRGEGWSGEFLIQRRDGATFIAHVSASLIQDDKTTLISIVAVSRDSTAQQQLQEANRLLAEASARLASAVDYDTQLTTLAQLAVPQLADWCAVHLLQADGTLEQVAVALPGTGTPQAAHDWLQNYLPLDDV